MRFISTFIAVFTAIFLSFAPASSAEKRVIPANKTSAIGFIYYSTGLGYNCLNPGKSKYKVAREANHGSIRLEWRKMKGNFHRGCKNTTMFGLAVYYTPHKGFRGNDEFVVRMTTPGLQGPASDVSRTWKMQVEVK